MRTTRGLWGTWLLVAVVVAFGLVAPASGSSVEPVRVEGNPKCVDTYGYNFGFKPQPEPPPTGTYTFPDGVNTVTITSDGTSFSFTSTISVDAVIVKGGDAANVYFYNPESFGDSGLHAPVNASGGYAAISHIEFCYDYEVEVSKTAETSFTRTFSWTIDKSVTPESLAMFRGDSGDADYTVSVTRSFIDSDWAVHGEITIENPSPFTAVVTGVDDVVTGGLTAPVDCGGFPAEIAPWDTLVCTYGLSLPDGSDRTNLATVTTQMTAASPVGGGSGMAPVVFGAPTSVVGPPTVTVTDTNGSQHGFSDTGSWSYSHTFSCDGDSGSHTNTATIVETGQSDIATVNVECYALAVTKDASTSFDRHHRWSIAKESDPTSLTLSTGQEFSVTYSVTLESDFEDSDWAVEGSIWVRNPAPIPATLLGVSDVVSPAVNAGVVCGVAFPYTLAAGGELVCTYSTPLGDGQNRTNTAAATLQNVPSGTTDFTGSAAVDFGSADISETDECIVVDDTFTGELGELCADAAPYTFTYNRSIGPYGECGSYLVDNTATFIAGDTQGTGSASVSLAVEVPCTGGCTLTQGYWKTHSRYGPAPYDDTWAQIGEDTPFFLSGQSYYEVLWTAPQGGNAYYILAHQYIAAELNGLNGASVPPAVADAFAAATELFQHYTPEDVGAMKGKRGAEDRAMFLGFAAILDQYNNGQAGPPHCSE